MSSTFTSTTAAAAVAADGEDQNTAQKRLVLVGGGHAHAQVIKALKHRPESIHVTLIDRQMAASYSGMVPGCIADIYTPQETLLELAPLAKHLDHFHQATVVDIDLKQQVLHIVPQDVARRSGENSNGENDDPTISSDETRYLLQSTPKDQTQTIPFDVLSLDIGSTSRGWRTIPGAKQYTLPTRPISNLVRQFQRWTQDIELQPRPIHVVIIGAGAAGIELSMSIYGRWKDLNADLKITLLNQDMQLLTEETDWCRWKLQSLLQQRNIHVIHNCTVQEVTQDAVIATNQDSIAYTHCVWSTGAEAHDLELHPLECTDRGWIKVTSALQSTSHPNVFAAGDCCHIVDGDAPPKAGVYAVRAGPVLSHNLMQACTTSSATTTLQSYEPQTDFLKLLVCGDGKALGFRFGIPLHGKWVMQLKDHIDQQFMDYIRMDEDRDATKQYDDDASRNALQRMDARDAAELLLTEDDGDDGDNDVDYLVAWHALREMVKDASYKQEVLDHVHEIGAARMDSLKGNAVTA
uniref:FAD/NAD(P)-binding domain-containing protein n=1 Tax=Craspedostauros australis TaxID=1486917 RepID=A0A7R9WN62_9STRA